MVTSRPVRPVALMVPFPASDKIIIPPDGEIITQTRDITPEIATEWLKNNAAGRPISKIRVARFVNVLQAGRWRHTHQGVAFNRAGELTDGQHRLQAIEQAALPTPTRMQVSFGVNDFAVIDTGANRSAGDIVGIAGITDGRRLAAAIRLMHPYYMGIPRPWSGGGSSRNTLDTESVLDLAVLHHEQIREQFAHQKRITRRLPAMSPAATNAGLAIGARWATANGFTEEFEEWREGLATGVDLGKDGRLALASWSAKAARALHGATRSELLTMLLLRAFNAYLNGEELQRMQVNAPGMYLYRLTGDTSAAARAAWSGSDRPTE